MTREAHTDEALIAAAADVVRGCGQPDCDVCSTLTALASRLATITETNVVEFPAIPQSGPGTGTTAELAAIFAPPSLATITPEREEEDGSSRASTSSPPNGDPEGWRLIESATVDYVLRYGGRCRDCADEAGVCPMSGLPCGGARKAVEWVLNALDYGTRHGFIAGAGQDALVQALKDVRVFVQDCMDTGHDRGSLGNLMSARDVIDAALASDRPLEGRDVVSKPTGTNQSFPTGLSEG